jgi:hypothetical protein
MNITVQIAVAAAAVGMVPITASSGRAFRLPICIDRSLGVFIHVHLLLPLLL